MIAKAVSGAFSVILAFIFNLDDFVEIMSTVTLLSYTMVAVCVLMLRYHTETLGLVRQSNSEASVSTHICGSEIPTEDSPLLWTDRVRQPLQRTTSLALAAIVTSCIGFTGLSTLIIWGWQASSLAKSWWAIVVVSLISLSLIACTMLLIRLFQDKTPLIRGSLCPYASFCLGVHQRFPDLEALLLDLAKICCLDADW